MIIGLILGIAFISLVLLLWLFVAGADERRIHKDNDQISIETVNQNMDKKDMS